MSRMNNVDQFYKILYDFTKNENLNFDEFYEKIKHFEFEDFRLHCYKASKLNEDNEIDDAIKEIEYSITCIKTVHGGYPPNSESAYHKRTDALGLGIIPLNLGSFTQEISKVYALAGEIYAKANNTEKSLENYIKYHYYNFQLKSEFESNVIVYSFRAFNEYMLSDIINNEITVSHPSVMNDPFDSLSILWINKKKHSDKKHLPIIKKTFNYFRVRSFIANTITMKEDKSIIQNILMWSHYANGHSGVCIKYRLSEKFINRKKDNDYKHCFLKKVIYTDKDVNIDNNSIDSDLAFTTKNKRWEYENEVRLISYNPEKEGNFDAISLDTENKIEAVYFGYSCEERHKKIIINVLQGNDVKFFDIENCSENVYKLIDKPHES